MRKRSSEVTKRRTTPAKREMWKANLVTAVFGVFGVFWKALPTPPRCDLLLPVG